MKNFDSYYDPPEYDETPCDICHYSLDDCTCLECEVCGVQGDPKCINVHISWEKFPHFKHALSERENRAEIERERALYELDKEIEEATNSWDRELP